MRYYVSPQKYYYQIIDNKKKRISRTAFRSALKKFKNTYTIIWKKGARTGSIEVGHNLRDTIRERAYGMQAPWMTFDDALNNTADTEFNLRKIGIYPNECYRATAVITLAIREEAGIC